MFEKLKERWGVESNWSLTLILVTFAVTGSLSAKVGGYLVKEMWGFSWENDPWYQYVPLRIITTFVFYQILLVIVGTCLGQFKFFWAFEKKMLSRFGIKFPDQSVATEKGGKKEEEK